MAAAAKIAVRRDGRVRVDPVTDGAAPVTWLSGGTVERALGTSEPGTDCALVYRKLSPGRAAWLVIKKDQKLSCARCRIR